MRRFEKRGRHCNDLDMVRTTGNTRFQKLGTSNMLMLCCLSLPTLTVSIPNLDTNFPGLRGRE